MPAVFAGAWELVDIVSDDLTDMLASHRQRIDAALSECVRRPEIPPALSQAMAYSLLATGKRLRPLLVVLACEASGGTAPQALPAACAVEMVHTYSLIHDDLPAMDDDDLRRGRPTCHKQFGEAMAILAGDALLTLAFEVICEGLPASAAVACCRELAHGAGAAGMVAGQVLDLAAEGRIDAPPPNGITGLEAIHVRKTGALIRACLRMGWHCSPEAQRPAVDAPLDRLDRYGSALGLAFQITDDLLDVQGTAEAAGKRVGKDANRGKLTYPGLLGVDESRQRAESLVGQAAEAMAAFGPASRPLVRLAQLVLNRDR